MKNTTRRNLIIGFGLSLLLLIISSLSSYTSIQNLLESARLVNHTDSVIQQLESIVSTLKDVETGQRGFLVAGKEIFLEPYNGGYEKALNNVENIRLLTRDNPLQQESCDQLQSAITERLAPLQRHMIEEKRNDNIVTLPEMEKGKEYMDAVRSIVRTMENRSQTTLAVRTNNLNKFSAYTPILILLAAVLSILITIVSFVRLNNDFAKREQLQKELEAKDGDITHRIDIVQDIAGKISAGNYQARINDKQTDSLGNVAIALNAMAESLDSSFRRLSNEEWMQAGVVSLASKILGENDVHILADNIINYIAGYLNIQVGVFYLRENEDWLKIQGTYAYTPSKEKEVIRFGEGLVGQAAISGSPISIKDIPQESIFINYASGTARPAHIYILPVYHETRIKGVMELGSLTEFTNRQIEFLKRIAGEVGTAINTARNRQKLQELLEETQAQTEELQAQHNEMESLNTELEAQAQNLQASEEELRVQQEELQQTNQELEERTRSLEEKNQVIVERNLDIQRKAEELEQSTKYKSEFMANMSHELRTPLNSILLLSRLLSENMEHNLSSEQVESAKVIQSSGNGLLSLIDEILDLSKIEAGKMELEYEHIQVETILDDMRSMFAPIAREKNIALKIEAMPQSPAAIEVDKMRLGQVLKNLLSNALKFTTQGGSVTLQVSAVKDAPALLSFSVIDTGIGIPKDKQQLIFDAFRQADGSTRRKYGGTGLGLSISRELAKLLGGDLTVKSDEGKGSSFTITVPVLKTFAPSKYTTQKEDNFDRAEDEQIQSFAPERVKHIASLIPDDFEDDDKNNFKPGDNVVLIIEDDINFAKSLLSFTRKRGYKGLVAVRGDLGIEMALAYKPLAILLDIQLPVKDGWEVMEELKSNMATRHIPVHIMSSMQVKKESLLNGAVDFIDKPVALEQMQEIFLKLEDALNRHPKKVLIVEENPKHAKALAYFLETFNVNAEIKRNVADSISALKQKEVDCVILDIGVPDHTAYETLETVKKNPGLENLPIIIFTGKTLSKTEEGKLKQYADSIVIKTAHSYQRILDEVSLFLHLIEKDDEEKQVNDYQKLGALGDVLKNKKVLVADDDVRNIFSLTRALEQHQMQVLSATDGKEALEILYSNPDVDAVLMDIMMPEMDGYESIRKIRQNGKFKNLPILAVTAKAMTGDREKCIEAGASDYISKPVDIDQLLSLLRVWLYDKTI